MTSQPNSPIRVMVVDDTITYRSIMSNVVKSFPQALLVDTASNGRIAINKLANTPVDLVFLDVEMPEMDGLQTLAAIKKQFPAIQVVIVSAINSKSADVTITALEAGALDFIAKPERRTSQENHDELHKRVQKVLEVMTQPGKTLPARVKTISRSATAAQPVIQPVAQPVPKTSGKNSVKIEAVCIGVSTGGPNALTDVIPRLEQYLDIPIFLVQHMPPVFTASLAQNLDRKSKLTVVEASDRERVKPGYVYIAPGGCHMVVEKQGTERFIKLLDTAPENNCRPSVDVLFQSIGQTYGNHCLAVIMTGMGSDGTKGVAHLKQLGVSCLTQSHETCVVYGMPRSVDEAGLSDESVPLPQLAERIMSLVRHSGGQR